MKAAVLFKNAIVFCSLFAMMYWFYTQSHSSSYKSTSSKPQEYMTDWHVVNFDPNGKPRQAMQAQYWEFVHAQGHSELVLPHVTIYKPNGDIWHLSSNRAIAKHATINDKITQVDMLDGVVIQRPVHGETPPMTVRTLELQYMPDEEKISSQQFVSLEQPGLTISGHGLLGYLDRNWIELHDKITTVYTPN